MNGPVDDEQEKNNLCGDLVSFHEDCIHVTCLLQYCRGNLTRMPVPYGQHGTWVYAFVKTFDMRGRLKEGA